MLHLLIDLRRFLLEILIQERLRRHEPVFGVTLHQSQGIGKGALDFLPCLPERPEPCAVDVRMSDADGAGRIFRRLMAELSVKFIVHPLGRNPDRCKKRLGRHFVKIEQKNHPVEFGQNAAIFGAVSFLIRNRIIRDFYIVPQFFNFPIQAEQFGTEERGQRFDAGIGVNGDLVMPCRPEIQPGVVDVHPLLQFTVHPNKQLRVIRIPCADLGGCDRKEDVIEILRHINGKTKPCVCVIAVAPRVFLRVERLKRRIIRHLIRFSVSARHPFHIGDPPERHGAVFVQYGDHSENTFQKRLHTNGSPFSVFLRFRPCQFGKIKSCKVLGDPGSLFI